MSLFRTPAFRQRSITAFVFVTVMLAGLFWNELSFLVVFGIVAIGCMWEFWEITIPPSKMGFYKKLVGLAAGLAIYYTFYSIFTPTPEYIVRGWRYYIMDGRFYSGFAVTTLFTIILFFSLIILELFDRSRRSFHDVAYIVIAMYYIAFPFGLLHQLVALSGPGFQPRIVFYVLWLNWTNDTCAYIIGARFGKTLVAPAISPKKTWEGLAGGLLGCIATGFLFNYFFKDATYVDWRIIGVIVSVFGALGDLVESMLKRSVGVKDSGSFMPGHGGFLDRFDAFIFVIPFVAIYLTLMIH